MYIHWLICRNIRGNDRRDSLLPPSSKLKTGHYEFQTRPLGSETGDYPTTLVLSDRRGKHHQWLTEDVGHPALAQHLHAVIGLMRASSVWDQFYRMMNRAFPKKGQTIEMALDD
jgi:hypothetical protein